MHFMFPNFRIMQKKDCSFRIYQNLKITYADPDHIFLAITQNWAMRLFVGFVMQGHNYNQESMCNVYTMQIPTAILHEDLNQCVTCVRSI